MSTLKISHYLSLVKFSHTVFALPFAIIGFFLGIEALGSSPDWTIFIKVVLCMVFARSAAMGFNRYIDRKFDEKNQRTAVREIPSGIISPSNALAFVIIMSLSFIGTTAFINPLCFALSPIALAVVLGYSYTKRFTWLCHIVLGLGLALAPIGAYLAVTGAFDVLPLYLSFAVLFWTAGFDVIYALQDEDFDRNEQLHSIPVWLGKKKALNLSSALHALTAAFLFMAGREGGFGMFYFIGLSVFLILLVYQHSIVKPNDLSRVNLAFGTTNGIASVVFAVFFLLEYFLNP
jgi:4-hydroxybenzoate polyprenyltransferase